jgi:hypothetical protein
MTPALHLPRARSQRGSRHPETRRSRHDGACRTGGVYVDRSTTGAVVMAWDVAQREGHEWVPFDNVDLQIWLAQLPAYIAPARRCGAIWKSGVAR